MLAWFRRRRDPLVRSTAELAALLRDAAGVAPDEQLANEYRLSAEALERAAQRTQRHGDAPTRDALTYITGNAVLNIREYLDDQHEMLKAQYALLIDQGAAVAALRADFQETAETLSDWRAATDDRLTSFEQRMTTSERDRSDIHTELQAAQQERQQLIGQLDQLTTDFLAFRERIEVLINQALPPEQVANYITMIERHEQALADRERNTDV